MAIIDIQNLHKQYGKKVIFEDFSLSVNEGECIAISGRSGCGKSTLLNMIGLLEGYEDGQIIIDDEKNIRPNSSRSNKVLREKISYLFQNFALADDETVAYNLNLAVKYVKGSKKMKQEMIEEALHKVGMSAYLHTKVYRLSGGEQQRVAVARILLKPSKIILADEPTGSLDPMNRDMVLSMLKTIHKNGKTIVIVTHDQYVADQCDRVIQIT